jgi:homospermidine synthase
VEYSTVTRVPFEGKILMLGCGSVAQCTLPLLLRHVVRPDQITVMDMVDNRARIADEIAAGVTYVIRWSAITSVKFWANISPRATC